nr:hypothetical protein [Tanacetum cinerariifolium]
IFTFTGVMSSASSAVTYTSLYTDSVPRRVFWGADEELSNEGSPLVIVYGYDGLPMLPVAPPSPDYILGLEEPQTPLAPQDEDEHKPMFIPPHDPDFVPEPIYPEIRSRGDKDEEEEEVEEHLALVDSAVVIPTDELVSPAEGIEPVIPPPSTDTATTGARITAHPEDDDDKVPKKDPVDYPADGGDDGDDEEESSKDDEDEEDDEMDVEADEEEEEHPALADSVVVAPTAADQAPSAEETKPFETDESAATPPPHPAYRTIARISILAPVPMPAWTDS